jgi:hypothetical protein
LPLKNKTNQLFLFFICCRLDRSKIGKEKKRKGEREREKIREKHKKNPKKK